MNNMLLHHILFFTFLTLFVACEKEENNKPPPINDEKEYFTNPIRDYGADPWMIYHDGYYYYSESNGWDKIYIIKTPTITGMADERSVLVWQSPPNGSEGSRYNIWGPHLNYVQGKWYIYYAAQAQRDDAFLHQRMWVLESEGTDPFGPYQDAGEVLDSDDKEWAIDGSVLEKSDGSLYFVWAGSFYPLQHQHTYIARMKDPTVVDRSTITHISTPDNSWESSVRPIQEGQRPLYVDKDGKTIIMFSANASWTDEYCLGSLTNTDGDFLNPSSWTKSEQPLFKKTASVFGPGGASYVKSPDGTEDWIVYHAAKSQGSGWDRNIRTQKFTWDQDNNPIFGEPTPAGVLLVVPSGE